MERLEGFVLILLIQLFVIIAAAQFGGWFFRRLGQPQVVGEILAGLILGPSCFGLFFPDALTSVFPPGEDQPLRVLGQIGLVLLMFDVGLSFDFSHLKKVKRTAMAVAFGGILFPFLLGIGVAVIIAPIFAADQPLLPFALFIAAAISITAIPILGRIMIDLKMQDTPIGVLTISAAAIDDAIGWILLAVVSGLVTGGFMWTSAVWQLIALTLFVALSFLIIRPLADRFSPAIDWSDNEKTPLLLGCMILAVFGFAIVTNLIGVFSVFGPFVLGACLSHRTEVSDFYKRTASPFVGAFMLPVFFTFTGLRTNIGLLDATGWMWCGVVFVVACVGKMAGCGAVTLWSGYSFRESAWVALMMNTRALMGLVAINIGRELGAIPDTVFTMLVVMAIGTTVMTVPLLKTLNVTKPLD